MSDNPAEDQPTFKRIIAVPFYSAIGATTNLGLSSDRITFKFRIVKVEAHFPDDALANLQVWAFVSRNPNVGTAPPPDNKILGFYSPTPYLIGSGEIVAVDCDVLPDPQEQFLKVYFVNANAYAVRGYCIITIETLEGISPEQANITVNAGDEAKYTLEEWRGMYDKQANVIANQTLEALSGTQDWIQTQQLLNLKGDGNTKETWDGIAQNLAEMVKYFTPSMHNDDFVPALQKWFGQANLLMGLYSMSEMLGDVASLGFLDFAKWLVDRDEQTWQIGNAMGRVNQITYEASIYEYTRQSANLHFLANIPDTNNLINMVVKEKLSFDDFQYHMKLQGLNEDWSQRIWDAHFMAPDFQTIMRAYWRSNWTDEQLKAYLKLVDLDPIYNDDVWVKLVKNVPPYPDLINMRVKEVINQATFSEALKNQGYYSPWADRIWAAHFTPASFTDFLTAMRRKLSVNIPVAEGSPKSYTFGSDQTKDEQTIKDLSILADYDPRYWDFFKTRIYNDPSYRMIMWGYESGAIPLDRVPDLVHRLGLNPIDEDWYKTFITTFQERPWITRYLTALQSAYIAGAITDTDLKVRVSAIPRNENIANWMIKIADVRKEIKSKGVKSESEQLISVAELKKAYVYGQINEDDFRTRLLQRGYMLLDVELIISIINHETEVADFGGKKEGLTTTEYFDAWRYGEMTEDDLRSALMTKGLNLNEINILINTKKKKWDIGNVENAG